MKKSIFVAIIFMFFLSFSISSCQKPTSCYDEKLYQEHKDDLCPMDCPGVIGCDGNTYCNACIANTQGIKVK